jgi:hypothetical protein
MKSALRKLRNQPCRVHPISENEQQTFSTIQHLQRYHPAIDRFPLPDVCIHPTQLALPSQYYIQTWNMPIENHSKIWSTIRTSEHGSAESCHTFVKTVHLLDPINLIKEEYTYPKHPFLPQVSSTWKDTVDKIHCHHNQAYVDNVANFIVSRFRELDLTPHCVLYYGCSTGISSSYTFNISSEFSTYRQCRWFWKGLENHGAKIVVSKPEEDDMISNFDEICKDITTCPFDDEEFNIELETLSSSESAVDTSDIESVHSVTFDIIQDGASVSSDDSDDVSSHTSDESDQDSNETNEMDLDISLVIPNMPVILIYQEAQEGVMDDLLEEEEVDGQKRGTQGWEARWIAWMFQVIAALCYLQKAIGLTHNDLHSNNIVWRSTKERFLYYRNKEGIVWRVPTFGKIFSIIDFGRSIFRVGNHLWISDDHWPNQDAGDQYNFGPFYDSSKPKNTPNPSFDLCRLAVSLIDGLFEDTPPKKKGKNVAIMSEEGSWKVYETNSPLYNLLWSWTVDDAGQTIYIDRYGNDKYDGFDLYIRIAHDVHHAIPSEQIHKPIFQQFQWKHKVDKQQKIYFLGC